MLPYLEFDVTVPKYDPSTSDPFVPTMPPTGSKLPAKPVPISGRASNLVFRQPQPAKGRPSGPTGQGASRPEKKLPFVSCHKKFKIFINKTSLAKKEISSPQNHTRRTRFY